MAVTYTAERAEVASTVNGNTYDTSAFTPTPNSLLILAYSGADSAPTYSLNSITEPTGTDLTWTLIRAGTERNDGTSYQNWGMYYCLVPSSTASTTVRLTWSEAIIGCCIWIGEFSGHHPTAPIAQSDVTTLASGTETHSLPGAVDANSITVYQNVVLRNPPAWDASGDGWTEVMDNGANSPAQGMFVAYKANDQTISFTGTDIASGSTIAEIEPAVIYTQSVPATATITAAITTATSFGKAIAASTTVGAALSRLTGKPVETSTTIDSVTDATFQAGANEYFVTVAIAGTPEGWVGT